MIFGPDAEVLRGDLEEAFHLRAARHGYTARVRAGYIGDVFVSLVRWWLARASQHAASSTDDVKSGVIMQGILMELLQMARALLRRPGYVAVVVLTLGLGIGATTTIYSVVDAMLVRPLPYPDADRLVVIGNTTPGEEWVADGEGLQRLSWMSLPNANDVVARAKSLQQIAVIERRNWTGMDLGNGPELLDVANVSANFFDVLSVKPMLGRQLQPADFHPDYVRLVAAALRWRPECRRQEARQRRWVRDIHRRGCAAAGLSPAGGAGRLRRRILVVPRSGE
jgi:hypothetical protein